jgi:hypothetical protein
MELIILVAVSSLLLVVFYVVQYRKFSQALKNYRLSGRQVEFEDWTKIPKIVMIVLDLIALSAVIVGIIQHDPNNWALGAVMLVAFTTEFFMTNNQYRLYHDDRSFLTNNGPAAYSSIKEFERNRFAYHIGFVKVHFYSAADTTVCPQAFQWLQQRQQQAALEKKERKQAIANGKKKKGN